MTQLAYGNSKWIGGHGRCRLHVEKNYGRTKTTNSVVQISIEMSGRSDNDVPEFQNSDNEDDLGEEEKGVDVVTGRGYEASFAANFHDLLPLLSEQETKVDEETLAMREFMSILSNRYVSTFRRSPQTNNLRPFAKRAQAQSICSECEGVGEIKCKYCDGDGFMQLEKDEFDPHFDGWILEPPVHVVGNYYHCPLCGGRCKTRCEGCAGSGLEGGMARILKGLPVDGVENLPKYAASDEAVRVATELFDMKKFLEQYKDRVEYAPDGLIIVRAKKRRQKRRKTKKKESTADQKTSASSNLVRKRGRPRKKDVQNEQQANIDKMVQDIEYGKKLRQNLSPGKEKYIQPKSRRSTDFLNTTDFKVGKRLTGDKLSQGNEN